MLSIYLYTPSPASEFCDYTRFYVVISKEIMPFSSVHLRTEGLRDGGDAICLLSWSRAGAWGVCTYLNFTGSPMTKSSRPSAEEAAGSEPGLFC